MTMAEESKIEKIISLAKRRGFVFPSSDIYGGLSGVYDFGPLGVEMENNLRNLWWRDMVRCRLDIVGLDSGIFMSPKVWQASGHTSGFSDPLVECRVCQTRSRADHLLEELGVMADEKMSEGEIGKIFDNNRDKLKCPKCGAKDFTAVKLFNLLVKSNLGDFSSENSEPVYLRGETCQGIYINFLNVLNTSRQKLPFGIAQIGKAFRNEIAPRQYLFRTREFEQMEMQYFIKPEQEKEEYEKLKDYRYKSLVDMGLKKESIRWHQHENLVFYAKEAFDIEYNYPSYGWKELEGIHSRGDYDLTQQGKGSGQDLVYYDEEKKEKIIPYVLESSIGLGRLFLAVLCDAYEEDEVDGEKRVVLKLKSQVAPVKIAILPLLKKDELISGAKDVFANLCQKYSCQYDETQSIGRRYRRQDEIGTPFCLTYDFESLQDKAVTVRDRDSAKQERVLISDLEKYLEERLK